MDSLIDTHELERALEDPRLRVFDATVHFAPGKGGRSGRTDWEAGHIPGSRFVDLLAELSDPESSLPYTRPSTVRLEVALGQLGISEDSRVVVYGAAPENTMWATRLWWLLRSAGLENVALLDGSFTKWKAEVRPVSTDPCVHGPTSLRARPDEAWWATKQEVRAAIGSGSVCTLNALPRSLHTGEAEMGYGRPGRIAGSRNAPFTGVLDPETGTLRSDPELCEHFQPAGALDRERVISYCGGGIAATLNGFALRRLGHPNVGVYDGSINEWSRNAELPMETGEEENPNRARS
ncbi:MAG: sulfurtransferase [Deltaproteobacteria bacterium]|nr:sulfurtransferase [Deltaproteobacteria bacterium]MBW2395583.1 sulfurtransferase [Deltaproteobacteria bacterium]